METVVAIKESIFNSITVGVMCYNEVGSIEKTVFAIDSFLVSRSNNFEILIVDDGSTDGSKELCAKLAANNSNVKVIYHPINAGIGETLRDIHFNASKKWVANVPADGQFDVQIFDGVELQDNQFVCYYRKENLIYNARRNYLSFVNKAVNKYLLGIDVLDINWVKIYPSSFFKKQKITLRSSLVESENVFFLMKHKYQMIELPSEYLPREAGSSKGSSFKVVKKALFDLLLLLFVCRIKRSN